MSYIERYLSHSPDDYVRSTNGALSFARENAKSRHTFELVKHRAETGNNLEPLLDHFASEYRSCQAPNCWLCYCMLIMAFHYGRELVPVEELKENPPDDQEFYAKDNFLKVYGTAFDDKKLKKYLAHKVY